MTRIWSALALTVSGSLLWGCMEAAQVAGPAPTANEASAIDPAHKAALDNMGLRGDLARDAGDSYIVDGDIRIRKDRLEQPAAGLGKSAQQRTTMLASTPNADAIYIIYHPNVTADWITATREAIQEWNALGTRVRLVEGTGFPASAIYISMNASIHPTTAVADFPHYGIAGEDITINPNYNYLVPGDKKWVMTHEIGHCLGFRHTNWLTRLDQFGNPSPEPVNDPWYNDPSYHVPGTPSNSTPDASSIMWATFSLGAGWNGFSWWDIHSLRMMYTDTRHYAPADFNGDGIDDLLFFEPGNNTIHLRLGGGLGGNWTTYGNLDGQMFTGDINGDGKSEVWFADRSNNTVSYRSWNGSAFNAAVTVVNSNAFGSLNGGGYYYALDRNGDGRDDLMFFEPSNNSIHFRNSAGTTLGSPANVMTFGNVEGQLIYGDVNGDGRDDIAFADRATGAVSLRISSGSSFYAAAQIVAPGVFGNLANGGFYKLMRIDAGNKLDLVFFDPITNNLSAKISGTVTPAASSNLALSATTFSLMTFGNVNGQLLVNDYNGDGREDIVFADRSNNTVDAIMSTPMGFVGTSGIVCSNCFGHLSGGGFYR